MRVHASAPEFKTYGHDPGSRRHRPATGGSEVADAIRVLRRSSRTLIRQARARYTTDLIKWPHRHAFDSIWQIVERVPGWFHEGSAAVMYALMRDQPPEIVVEIGSYLGRSTVFFGLALKDVNPQGRVVAIDPHTGDRQQLEGLSTERLATYDLFRQHCMATGVESLVDPRVAASVEVAAGWSEPVDLLYVDGWHSYDAVVADGEAWLPYLSAHGVVIFDDYVAYGEVREAIHDLADRRLYRLWGSIFGQAIGGAAGEPPAAVRRALLLSGGRLRGAPDGRR
jgi:predicted O-methyltransferase YrrM